MEQANSNGTNSHAHHGREGIRAEWSAAPDNDDSVLILYGTVTGNAERLANKLATSLRRAGFPSQVRDMAHCQPSVLMHANCVLMVVSTYGDGEPPDDAARFWECVVHGHGLDLRAVKYSVLALGNTTYDHFCKCGRDFDAALERHGALRIYPRMDCDVDYEAPARRWLNSVLQSLQQKDRASFIRMKRKKRIAMLKSVATLTIIVMLSLSQSAHAHYVWLERNSDGPARAYLGEWIKDIREQTGGLLDRTKAPRVFLDRER